MQEPEDLDAVFILPEHDDMTLLGKGMYTLTELRAFVPKRFIPAQPLQSGRQRGSIVAGLLFTPVFPSISADLGEVANCRSG